MCVRDVQPVPVIDFSYLYVPAVELVPKKMCLLTVLISFECDLLFNIDFYFILVRFVGSKRHAG